MTKLLIQGTHGRENAEKATLPFIMANVAATADQEVAVLLTSDAVWLVTDGYADDIESDGLPNLGQLIKECVDNGAAIWACGACPGLNIPPIFVALRARGLYPHDFCLRPSACQYDDWGILFAFPGGENICKGFPKRISE